MPSIIEYEEQVRVSGAAGSVPRGNPGAQTSGLNVLASVAERIGALKEQDAAAEAALTLSKTQSEWQRQLLERQEQAEPGAPDFTKTLEKDFDEYSATALATAKTRNSKLYLQEGLARTRGELLNKGLLFESGARVAHRKEQFADSIDLTATAAELDPGSYADRLEEQLAALDVLEVPPAEKAALRDTAVDLIQGRAAVGLARRDPDATMKRLIEPTADDALFRTLSPRARDLVLNEVESAQRLRINAENRAYTLAERAEKEVADEKSKDGDKLFREGALSSNWIEQNRRYLTPEDYRYFSRLLQGGSGDGPRNTEVYAELRERASRGDDVRADARKALQNGSIRVNDYDALFDEVESDRPGWYKRGTSFIATSAGVSDINPDPAAAQRKAAMLDDWQLWAQEHPKATDAEAKEAYTRIVDEYGIVDRNKMTIALRQPRFLVGDRVNPDIEATEAATVEAFQAGEMAPAEFERQAELIAQWKRALGNQPQPKAKP